MKISLDQETGLAFSLDLQRFNTSLGGFYMGVNFPFTDKYIEIKEHIDEIVVLASLMELPSWQNSSISYGVGNLCWAFEIRNSNYTFMIEFFYDELDYIIEVTVGYRVIEQGKVSNWKYLFYGAIDTEEELERLYSGLQKLKELL